MSHLANDLCIGCRAAARLHLTDETQVELIHDLTRNMLHLSQIAARAEAIDFDILTELNESVVEDVIAEMMAIQPPSNNLSH